MIVRKERPHPGAQLRFTDPDGHRYTAFATNTAPGGPGRQLADLELRHRRRARAEDRIRTAKDTGLRNLPLHGLDQNRIWQAVIALACDITAWTQMLALAEHPARRWEPKRLRLRIFSLPADLAQNPTGPWNRRTERPRPNCHTRAAESNLSTGSDPVKITNSTVRKIRARADPTPAAVPRTGRPLGVATDRRAHPAPAGPRADRGPASALGTAAARKPAHPRPRPARASPATPGSRRSR